jgi:hypothetical protein
MSFQPRFEKVLALANALEQNKQRIVEFAVKDLQFTVKDSVREVELAISRLPMYGQAPKAVGGYGLSGWIWETVGGRFRIKQGPKLFSLETSALA